MLKQIPFIALLVFLAVPAFAQQNVGLSESDEEFLAEMPADSFPGNENPGMQDIDGDGIAENVADMIPTGMPGQVGTAEPQKQVQYVYKPGSDTYLRRTIQDPRIEDGYVQGLMEQRGPTE